MDTGTDHLRELFAQYDLLPNSALSSLPPLPQTPHHSRQAYMGAYSDENETKYEPRSQRRRGPERENPMSAAKRHPDIATLSDTEYDPAGRLPRSTTLPSLSNGTLSSRRDRVPFETQYPTLSTRQSSLNTARNISPTKHEFLSPVRQTSALLHPSSAARPTADSPFKARRDVSASFMLPSGADVSMLQDVTFGDMGRLSLGNDTMNMDFGMLRVKAGDQRDFKAAAGSGGESRYGDIGSVRDRTAPSPARHRPASVKRVSRPPMEDFDKSTLLPCTPSKVLLSSTNLITREEPPWHGTDSQATVMPTRSPRPPADTLRRTGSVKRSRLPTTTSSNFLAPPAQDHAGDVSSLLPVSPLKSRHLLSDEHLLTQTKMEDETMLSMSLIMPPGSPAKARTEATEASAGVPSVQHQSSPAKTPRNARNRMKADPADMTMDIAQMMARVKPAKGMKAEESVLDLFRAECEDDNANTSGMSDQFIPLELRPGLVRSKSLSRLELEKRSAISADLPTFASPTRTLPRTRPTSYVAAKAIAPASPIKSRPTVAPAPITSRSKRVSLSVGALPLPSSASLQNLELPSRRLVSPMRCAQPHPLPTSTSTRMMPNAAPRQIAKTSMPPPAAPSSRAPQAPKSRVGSTASIASTARTSTLPRAASVRTLSRPVPPGVVPPKHASTRPATRPAAMTRPDVGSIARSGTTAMPRSFGGDAAGVSNRLPRPVPASTSARVAKGSMGPPAGAIPRSTAIPTAAKSRTLSTPATAVSRPPPSARGPTAITSRAPTSRTAALPSSRPASGPSTATSRATMTSTSAETARIPTTSAPAQLSSAHQTGTIGRSSSKSAAAAGLADIRARLDRLQARHQISRPVR